MDAETDLNSVSRRLNSALISKGLLDQSNRLNFHEGSDARKIINFIYDIIRRRDKDSELKENLVNTIHEHKASETRLKKVITQLESKCDHFERQFNIVAVQRDNFSTNVKTLELQNRNLQDDIARQKTVLQQIRAQDANERRKRDQQILRMKEKAGFEIRRAKSISTTTGKFNNSSWSSERYVASSQSMQTFSEHPESGSLFREQASNIIPNVIQELTHENARLIALIRETSLTLNVFTGEKSVNNEEFDNVLQYLPSTFPELSIEINNSLEALREILHEPKYVSIEEVHHREQEIERLKKQLDSMTTNWKDAIQTMDEWNQYMDGKVELPPPGSLAQQQGHVDQDETHTPDRKMRQIAKEDDKEDGLNDLPVEPIPLTCEMLSNADEKISGKSSKMCSIQDKENMQRPPTRISESSTLPSRIPIKPKCAKPSSAPTANYPWSKLSEITNKASHFNFSDQQGTEQDDVVTPVKTGPTTSLLAKLSSTARSVDEAKVPWTPVTLGEAPIICGPLAASSFKGTPPSGLGASSLVRSEILMDQGALSNRNGNYDEEDGCDGDNITPTVRQIIIDAGVTPARRTLSNETTGIGRPPLPRKLLQLTSSPTVELSPIKLSSIESSAPRQPLTSKRERESNTVGIYG
ncbi:Afadin and alpha-actinin-binding-domain-containing protein [Lipomyces chichibuensis]|uniref:Afadin and alpha-actinin-binding-domain-containing protein n=1 Tax=Lipomyces chichibuensis TaxID=1546026 RepID=UPI003343AD41